MTATTDTLSPFISTLADDVVTAARAVLSLKPDVEMTLLGVRSKTTPTVDLRLSFPNGQALGVALSHPDATHPVWKKGRFCGFSYRTADSDPGEDPALMNTLSVILKLLRVTENARGETPSSELWSQAARHEAYDQVEDYMYRQISHGTVGTTGYLRLGFRCNQDCWFCWQGREWPDAPVEKYREWLEEIAAAGVHELSLTGGEPTLHPELPALIERATKVHGMTVMLQSNAIRLRKPDFAAKMKAAGLGYIFVSLHAADPGISDRMTRAPGTHVGTVAGIVTALQAGIRVIVNCVVEEANFASLADHAQLIVDRFVTPMGDNPVMMVSYSHPAAYFDRERWTDSMRPLDELRPHLLAAATILQKADVQVETMGTCGFPPCVFRGHPDLMRLLADGDADRMDPRDTASRTHPLVCDSCVVKDSCLGPRRAYLEKYGDRGLVPFSKRPDGLSYGYTDDLRERLRAVEVS